MADYRSQRRDPSDPPQPTGDNQDVRDSALQPANPVEPPLWRPPAELYAPSQSAGHGAVLADPRPIPYPKRRIPVVVWALLAILIVLVLAVVFLLGRISAQPQALPLGTVPSERTPSSEPSSVPPAPSPSGGPTGTGPSGGASPGVANPGQGADVQWSGKVRIGDQVCISFENPPPRPADGAFADLCYRAADTALEVVVWTNGSVWDSSEAPSKDQCVESLSTNALSSEEKVKLPAKGKALCLGGNMGDNVIFVRVRSADSSASVVDAVMWN
ncbi:hypothetical protein ACFY36_41545 [Actinoplanes sp. NPDC000266]